MNQLTHKRVFADIPIYSYDVVDSTQDVAKQSIDLEGQECVPGQIIGVYCAQHQTAGLGRRGRKWTSTPGSSLLITYVIRKEDANPWTNLARLIVANTRVLNELNIPVGIKWPNDIVSESGQKFGGCLTEVVGDFLFVGIGINLKENAYGDELKDDSCSAETFGVKINTTEYVDSVLDNYVQVFDVLNDYKTFSQTLGKEIEVEQISQTLNGVALDIKADGSLLLEDSSGVVHSVIEGDVVHARLKF